jgi:hypothetical protein
MTRELVEYFIQNNYDLNDRTSTTKICQIVLDKFPVLKNKIVDMYAIESRIRLRNNGQKPCVSFFRLFKDFIINFCL